MRWSRWLTWSGLVVLIFSPIAYTFMADRGPSDGYQILLLAIWTGVTLVGLVATAAGFVLSIGDRVHALVPQSWIDRLTCFAAGGVLVAIGVYLAATGRWWLVLVPGLGAGIGLWRVLRGA